MKAPQLTSSQIGLVLDDIAHTAYRIRQLGLILCDSIGSSDTDRLDVLTCTVMQLAERIGWAADMVSERSPGSLGAVVGDAIDWMMPPLFEETEAGAVSRIDTEGGHNE